MRNSFFTMALAQATKLTGKPGRLLKLATQLIARLYTTDRGALSTIAWKERILTLARLVASYARGEYRAIPSKMLLTITAALLYFLNPFDLIPDVVAGIGLTDDLAVLAWVTRAAGNELNKFILWEKEQMV